MPIELESSLRFAGPSARVPLAADAVSDLLALARKIRGDFTFKRVLETFKEHFCRASGESYAASSSTDWAESDLWAAADAAAEHAPAFIAAFFDACEELEDLGAPVPGHAIVNAVLAQYGCEFRVQNGKLVSSAPMVEAPTAPLEPEAAVSKALADAAALVGQSGAASAIDRAHTALHGYLRQLCGEAGIEVNSDDTTARLFKSLRQGHPAFRPQGPRADDVTRLLNASATIVDALAPIRNKASLAHSNELLDEPEAAAALNAVRTVFHYAQACIRRSKQGAG
jgi:hypothetical protein